ncbi:MAG: metallophosphoesterase [Roseiarcus sp.]|uniref:metallophosphoesterase family protein n=1 Tax=Roseiarcus sp. TaxID=1969460 RepID=UPI003C596838
MNEVSPTSDRMRLAPVAISPLLDPRLGDMENDHSATKQRTLLAIAGSLLAEISLTKLLFAWFVSILLPAVLLGLAPLVLTAWIGEASDRFAEATGVGAALVVLAVLAVGWIGWRPLFRLAETNFWSLNALAVQPGYAFWREALRHLTERSLNRKSGAELARIRSLSCAGAGILLFAVAGLVAFAVWPQTRWMGSVADLASPRLLIFPTIANTVVIMSSYLAFASLVWGFADAGVDQPLDLEAFDAAPAGARVWRVAHLSDVHVVGERYGFRVESGRGGPRGNDRLEQAFARLAALHAKQPLDLVLVSGDMTDAGTSAEWAEFLDIVGAHPELAARMLILPGNHDVNIVDRTNPARLDLPFSPIKALRKMRALSAMAAVQGMRVTASTAQSPGSTLSEALESRRTSIEDFAANGGFHRSSELARLWHELFPLILPPDQEDGLGVAILNSNADTNFSFTNALGLMAVGQALRLTETFDRFPKARWIVALHHHLTEYPMPVAAFSERVGTALINGSWFLRVLKPYASRIVVMHGHRHKDWIGACGLLKIVSAPSPVMAKELSPTHFYIHALAAGPDGSLRLLMPERVEIAAPAGA